MDNDRPVVIHYAEYAGKKVFMKKRNVLVVCTAAGLCLAFALLLVGGMGVYAEKAGTQEVKLEVKTSEDEDALTKILMEEKEQKDVSEKGAATEPDAVSKQTPASSQEALSDEALLKIWEAMYAAYPGTEEEEVRLEAVQQDAQALNEDVKYTCYTLDETAVGISEMGLTVLKEIRRLYPGDALDGLKICELKLKYHVGANHVQWEGTLENDYAQTKEAWRSYAFEVDVADGTLLSFGRSCSDQKSSGNALAAWTDEAVKAHAKELVETFQLSGEKELDWSGAEIAREADYLEKADTRAEWTLIFRKKGEPFFYLSFDAETGEISRYLWRESSKTE